jgi:hypothetical protein
LAEQKKSKNGRIAGVAFILFGIAAMTVVFTWPPSRWLGEDHPQTLSVTRTDAR